MLLKFFDGLRKAGVPVSIQELLTLLEAMEQRLAFASVDDFYLLSRTCMVKDEKYYDRFDKAFTLYFNELQDVEQILEILIPEDWLREEFRKNLTEEEKAQIDTLGGLEKLIEQFKERLKEQQAKHKGGNKWVGTGGSSPFGNAGYHPEGIRVGGESEQKRAAKVWEQRQYRNLDDSVEIGTRNIKVALRRLRKFARSGANDELDLDDTIHSTAKNAGYLDLKMVPERHNAVKVLLFLDVGGSMDSYVRTCEELFSAARAEFKHLEHYYFHNMLYEYVWRDSRLHFQERIDTMSLLHTYGSDYKVIVVGDASMSPFEITTPGGSVDFFNEEPGAVWLDRLSRTYEKVVWLNPVKPNFWDYTASIRMIRQLVDGHMYPLTLDGLEEAIKHLSR